MSTYKKSHVKSLPIPPDYKEVQWREYYVDNAKLCKAVSALSKSLRHNGVLVTATRELAQNVTRMVDELKAVAMEPTVKRIEEVKYACTDARQTVDTVLQYIDKIKDFLLLGTKLQSLADKETTKSSLNSDLREFRSIIEEMQRSLSEAEETYPTLQTNDEAVRSCATAQAACARQAQKLSNTLRQTHTKKKAVLTSMKALAVQMAPPVIVGGAATVLTLGIAAPLSVGIICVVARKPVKAAVENITELFSAIDEVPKACSLASWKCASVGAAASQLGFAVKDVQEDLMCISKALDEALESPVYTVTVTSYQQELRQLMKQCANSFQCAEESYITVQEKVVELSARCSS